MCCCDGEYLKLTSSTAVCVARCVGLGFILYGKWWRIVGWNWLLVFGVYVKAGVLICIESFSPWTGMVFLWCCYAVYFGLARCRVLLFIGGLGFCVDCCFVEFNCQLTLDGLWHTCYILRTGCSYVINNKHYVYIYIYIYTNNIVVFWLK
jgi:hypothetical protein